MKLQIELRRFGMSRSSERGIQIQARVVQSGRIGEDMIAGQGLRDLQNVKAVVQDKVDTMFRQAVEIEWLDRTAE